eukprot:TRINITY_DN7784_c0_g1_i1.p1 TRINITY_DN7784_c0_g1~~TRINITY_DN7784_c0_g1_i1.p1  ORF type:complete len:244 (+),score=66.80 TRINITY_DN7784_c0_g1_i1:74-805(+)
MKEWSMLVCAINEIGNYASFKKIWEFITSTWSIPEAKKPDFEKELRKRVISRQVLELFNKLGSQYALNLPRCQALDITRYEKNDIPDTVAPGWEMKLKHRTTGTELNRLRVDKNWVYENATLRSKVEVLRLLRDEWGVMHRVITKRNMKAKRRALRGEKGTAEEKEKKTTAQKKKDQKKTEKKAKKVTKPRKAKKATPPPAPSTQFQVHESESEFEEVVFQIPLLDANANANDTANDLTQITK